MSQSKKQKVRHSVRYQAVKILTAIEEEGAYSNIRLNGVVQKEKYSSSDASLLREIVYGVTQRRIELDYALSSYVQKPNKVALWVRNVLRMSVYQMLYLDKIPDHAILFDAVEIAKVDGHQGIVKFVNGVLRNVQRKGPRTISDQTDPIERLHIDTSTPKWLVEKLIHQLGMEKATSLLHSLLLKPYLSIRVQDPSRRSSIAEGLRESGIEVTESPISMSGLRAKSGQVTNSQWFQSGEITIQDESSQLVAPYGRLKESDRVLDACAAPGGKTIHMASYLNEAAGGSVMALDIYEHKTKLIQENAKRMNVSELVHTKVLDAKMAYEAFEPESFDVIFVDAPCSGLGLMRRKPEIKYNVEPNDFDSLHQEQIAILESVVTLLKPNGRLIYSTCTIVKEENEETVTAFLEKHPEMQRDKTHPEEISQQLITKDGNVMIYPDDYHTDGFYICAMKKLGDRGVR